MKICIVTHNVVKGDGQGRVNYEVACYAAHQGHQITLLASRVAPEVENITNINWVKIDVDYIPTILGQGIIFSILSSSWLRKYRDNFDVIQVNGAATSAYSQVNAVHFVHSCWLRSTVHPLRYSKNIYGLYQWLYSALGSFWEKKEFHKSKILIAVSDKIKSELISLGISEHQIRVVLNGVDTSEFYPGQSKRAELGFPQNNPLALFVGDIRSNRKNLDTVLKSLIDIPELHLIVVGKIDNSPYINMTRELCLEDRVYFLGYRTDIAEIMRSVDLFVFPSRYEACTLALLEAMASGLPVVTASTTGGAEIVVPESGIVIEDPEDSNTLTKTLENFLEKPEKLVNMGRASRRIAEQHSWTNVAEQYLQIFREIVEDSSKSTTT